MKLLKVAAAIAALTAVTAASAATWTVDYRHDYRDVAKQNFDRIAIIAGFENGISFYVDSSFASGSNGNRSQNEWGDFVTNATEMSIAWTKKFDNGFSIQPGLVTESTSGLTAYKPYLRVQYNTDFGLWAAIRPRFDYARNDNEAQDYKTARLDAWLGYGYKNFGINYNFTYMKALDNNPDGSDRLLFDNKSTNTEHNVAINYRMGQWNPYFEIGNIGVNNSTDNRQTRLRVGIQYTFQ